MPPFKGGPRKQIDQSELNSYGQDGRVIISVSSVVYSIIDLAASMLTPEHLSYYNEYPAAIKGMFQQSIYRSLGLSAHLGWARLVIDRTKEQIRYPGARSNNTSKNEGRRSTRA